MLKYLSLFSGIGSPEQALKNLGVEFELFGFSEIDKYAIKSYCAVHEVDENLNLGDITKIDIESLPLDIDLITHGSPCQDFSVAGKGKGGDLGSGTRSSLMWNTVAIVEHCQPKFVIWENVKNVLSKKHRHNFDKYLEEMDRIGYNSFYQVLNAKDYGVPQNRERIFVISIRKDLNKDFEFPKGLDNGIRLKDILESEVDEKYYLSLEKTRGLIEEYKGKEVELPCIGASRGRNPENRSDRTVGVPTRQFLEVNIKGISNTLTSVTKDNLVVESKVQSIVNLNPSGRGMSGEIYDANYLSPTLTTNKGEGSKILVESNELKFIGGIGDKDIVGDEKGLSRNFPQGNRVYDAEGIACSQTANGGGIGGKTGLYMVGLLNMKGSEQVRRVYDPEGICPCLDTMQGGNRQPKVIESEYRIRKLTPKECWRLMGFKDEQFLKAEQVCSNSQLYKQAGNSIVVNVMEEIFKNLMGAE